MKKNKTSDITQKSVKNKNKNLTITYSHKDLQPSHVMEQRYINKWNRVALLYPSSCVKRDKFHTNLDQQYPSVNLFSIHPQSIQQNNIQCHTKEKQNNCKANKEIHQFNCNTLRKSNKCFTERPFKKKILKDQWQLLKIIPNRLPLGIGIPFNQTVRHNWWL